MTLSADTPATTRSRGLLLDLAHVLRTHLHRAPHVPDEVPTPQDALLRAMCHDMRSPLAALEAALGRLDGGDSERGEWLELAQAQAEHLSSMLRTAAATGGATRRPPSNRLLRDVLLASLGASGLPSSQLTVEVRGDAGEVPVADARVQRIVTNLLENAHRHGGGAPVRLVVRRRRGWVDIALTQAGLGPDRIADHLRTPRPPVDLTGLGLWSVQRQTRELGGRIVWEDDGASLTLIVALPDR
ncbi:ATP-binding protein [Geodermatophilus sp. URMC 64]